MSRKIRPVLALAVLALCFSVPMKADTVMDKTLNVTYMLSSATAADDPAGTVDVTLVVNAAGFNAGSGFLTAVDLQFSGATAVTLESAPGGTTGVWTNPANVGLDSGGCNTSAAGDDWCIQNLGAAGTTVPGGPYTFVFDVTGLTSDTSDIKAAYNTLQNNSGKNLGLTSQGIDIGTPPTPPVPEPGTLTMLGFGLVAIGGFGRRRFLTS